jgi:hypothetical protein
MNLGSGEIRFKKTQECRLPAVKRQSGKREEYQMQLKSLTRCLLTAAIAALVLGGCAEAPTLASPAELKAPVPIAGNTGKYMSPFTEDGTVAPWVEKGRAASAGSAIGSAVGAEAGKQLLSAIPIFGGIVGQKVGEASGRAIALQMAGGEDYIRQTSDISFANVDDLAVYMYVTNSGHKDYPEVLNLTQQIYPELEERYVPAIMAAPRRGSGPGVSGLKEAGDSEAHNQVPSPVPAK